MNQGTVAALLILEGIGALVTIGFGIAAIIAWRKTKHAAETARHKAVQVVDATEDFLAQLKRIANGDATAA